MRHPPPQPMTPEQRQLVEDNYKLIFAGCKKYRRGDIDRDLMHAEFAYALCCAACTYDDSKGSFSGWAYWHFFSAFMQLLRDKHKRGITTQEKNIKTTNLPTAKRRDMAGETSMESLQEAGLLRDRHRLPVDEQLTREMRDDYQILRQRIDGIRLDIIESRMRGESYKSVGQRYKLSKQRVHMLSVEAIEEMRKGIK